MSPPLRDALRTAHARLEDRPLVVVLVAAAITSSVVLTLAWQAGWQHMWGLASARHSWAWLGACLAGELAAYGGYVLTLRGLARVDDGPELGIATSLRAVVAGFGVFAATRSSGGFAVDYWAFRQAGAGKRKAIQRVLGLGFLEYVVLSVSALAASVLLFFGWDGHERPAITLPALIVIPVLVVALWMTSPKRAERLSRRREGRIRRLFADSVGGAVTVRALLRKPRRHGTGILGTAIYYGGDILCLWAALRLVDVQVPVAALVLGYTAGYLLTRRALPAGGAGFVEVALTLGLAGMGIGFAPALLGVVVYRVFNFWLPIVPALALMPAVRDLRERFQHAEQVV
ncbi:MAG TPA: lysylphosphatidylglycerol synthase transmembrane domain-containing protein [Gaiellales bacterium]|jgi:hypothetical protein